MALLSETQKVMATLILLVSVLAGTETKRVFELPSKCLSLNFPAITTIYT
jgi:hypothetical protein